MKNLFSSFVSEKSLCLSWLLEVERGLLSARRTQTQLMHSREAPTVEDRRVAGASRSLFVLGIERARFVFAALSCEKLKVER